MNIFYLDKDPRLAAEYHCDKHVVKMILESAQLLSAAHRLLDGTLVEGKKQVAGSLPARWRKTKKWELSDERERILYSASHINHPSCIWARSNIDHYRYLYDLFVFLIAEYKYRYKDKTHKCEELVDTLLDSPININYEAPWQDPPQAMPEECKIRVGKSDDTTAAYRNYYIMHKSHFAKWTRRPEPIWWRKPSGI
jgi:hypothetical protein